MTIMHNPRNKAEVVVELQKIQDFLARNNFVAAYTIADYPIGRTARGQCRLSVEYKMGHGYRTVKETTDKAGNWCKPKHSIYQGGGLIVVSVSKAVPEVAGWFRATAASVYSQSANGQSNVIALAPATCVRRKATSHKIVTQELRSGQKVQELEVKLDADAPALIEAFDLWNEEVSLIVRGIKGQLLKEAS